MERNTIETYCILKIQNTNPQKYKYTISVKQIGKIVDKKAM